jgi:hypothetical protein
MWLLLWQVQVELSGTEASKSLHLLLQLVVLILDAVGGHTLR